MTATNGVDIGIGVTRVTRVTRATLKMCSHTLPLA